MCTWVAQDQLRDKPLTDLTLPIMFVRGTKDAFSTPGPWEATRARLASARVVVLTQILPFWWVACGLVRTCSSERDRRGWNGVHVRACVCVMACLPACMYALRACVRVLVCALVGVHICTLASRVLCTGAASNSLPRSA